MRWNARAFVDHLNDSDVVLHLGTDLYSRAGRRIQGGIVEQVEQRLFQENSVQRQHRQVGCEVDADAVVGEYLAGALQCAADDLLEFGQFPLDVETAKLEPRRVQQIRETKRLSRSASSSIIVTSSSRVVWL